MLSLNALNNGTRARLLLTAASNGTVETLLRLAGRLLRIASRPKFSNLYSATNSNLRPIFAVFCLKNGLGSFFRTFLNFNRILYFP